MENGKIMRNEYPRPELVRKKWLNLNGEWDFAFDFGASGVEMYFYDDRNMGNRFSALSAGRFDKKINVPFCPESKLSGIGYTDFIGACCYKKCVTIPDGWEGRILLHFEAAFHTAYVTVNGKFVGRHKGGYTPFSFDITDSIDGGRADIFVYCTGDSRNPKQPSGKQSMTRNSMICTYTRCTGIWQTVWMECVPETYLTKIQMLSDPDNSRLNVQLQFSLSGQKDITLTAMLAGKEVGKVSGSTTRKDLILQLPLTVLKTWSMDDPTLYDLKIEVRTNKSTDLADSYFAMRKLEWDDRSYILNGKRICLKMVLDQGYYPDGIYTAPSANDLAKDIELAKAFGFNAARLHQKVFERRYLYECDKRGFLVWDEYPNWGFDYTSDSALQYYLNEWMEVLERDFNHPSIVGWVPLNETYWDVFNRKANVEFTRQLYLETKRYDFSRPCVDASGGWHVQTDIFDTHDYEQDTGEFDRRYSHFPQGEIYNHNESYSNHYSGEMFLLSEYGAIRFGNAGNAVRNEEEFRKRFISFVHTLFANPRMAGFCYSQLYDIEQETNGLCDYRRNPKFSKNAIDAFHMCLTQKAAVELQENDK